MCAAGARCSHVIMFIVTDQHLIDGDRDGIVPIFAEFIIPVRPMVFRECVQHRFGPPSELFSANLFPGVFRAENPEVRLNRIIGRAILFFDHDQRHGQEVQLVSHVDTLEMSKHIGMLLLESSIE